MFQKTDFLYIFIFAIPIRFSKQFAELRPNQYSNQCLKSCCLENDVAVRQSVLCFGCDCAENKKKTMLFKDSSRGKRCSTQTNIRSCCKKREVFTHEYVYTHASTAKPEREKKLKSERQDKITTTTTTKKRRVRSQTARLRLL